MACWAEAKGLLTANYSLADVSFACPSLLVCLDMSAGWQSLLLSLFLSQLSRMHSRTLPCYLIAMGVLSPLQEQVAVCLERFWCSSWDDHIFWEKMPTHGSSLYVSLLSWFSGGFCSYQQTPVPPQEDLLYNDCRLSGGRQGGSRWRPSPGSAIQLVQLPCPGAVWPGSGLF